MLTQQPFTRISDRGEHRIRKEITTISEVWGGVEWSCLPDGRTRISCYTRSSQRELKNRCALTVLPLNDKSRPYFFLAEKGRPLDENKRVR
jgi:hypothetical protein